MAFGAGDIAELDDDLAKKLKKAGIVGDPKPDETPATPATPVAPTPGPAPVVPVNPAPVEPVNPAPLVQKGKK